MTGSQLPPVATDGPAPHALSAIDIEQACGLGLVGDRVAIRDEDDVDVLQTRAQTLHLFIDRIGWVADVSLRKLGDSGSFARAEDWMLPGA